MSTLTRTRPAPLAPGEVYTGTPEQILADVMGTYRDRLTLFIAFHLSRRDWQLAEDLAQETFTHLWRWHLVRGTVLDDRVYGLLAQIARQMICHHLRRLCNHETAADLTDPANAATRAATAPPTDTPHLTPLFAELESAKDALVPVATAYRTAHRFLLDARLGLRNAVRPESVARSTETVRLRTEAEQVALAAFKDAAERVAELRAAWDAAAGAQSALVATR